MYNYPTYTAPVHGYPNRHPFTLSNSYRDLILTIHPNRSLGEGARRFWFSLSWRAFRNYVPVKMTDDPIIFDTLFVVFRQPQHSWVQLID